MREELQNKLYEKYPEIFRQKNMSMRETCMCWGFDCSDGWYDLIDELCANIQNHIENENRSIEYKKERGELPKDAAIFPQVEATQVKEKFGGLRFYVNHYDEFIRGLIDMAEGMSYKICEYCGNPGTPNSEGWITTLCKPCREEYDRKWQKLEEEAKARLTVNMKDVTMAP
jgi:hypothetical protein